MKVKSLLLALLLALALPSWVWAQPDLGPGDIEPEAPPCAQIVTVGKTIERANCQAEGDVVAVMPCTHKFSKTETTKFVILRVEGLHPAQVRTELDKAVSDLASEKIKKFPTNLKALDATDKAVLASAVTTPVAKKAVISTKVVDNSVTAVVVGGEVPK